MQIDQAFQLALQHHQAGQLPQAENLYRQILAQQPRHVGALHYLGVIAHQVGRNDIAVDLIRQALALQPSNAEIHANLGAALKEKGETEQAVAAARQAIALKPDYAEAYSNLSDALNHQGETEQALAAAHKAISLKPNFWQAYNNLSHALRNNGQPNQAIAAARQAISLNPNYPQAYNNLGNALRDQRQFDQAIDAYRQATILKPDYAEAHSNLGTALSENLQLDQAIAAHRQAIALRPNCAEFHNNLAAALGNNGQSDEAVAAYRQALAIKPEYAEAYNNLGNTLQNIGQLDEAIAAYHQALVLKPRDALFHYNLAAALHLMRRLDEAVDTYHQALAINPEYAEAHNNLGIALKDLGQLDQAIAAYRQAITLRPEYSQAHSNLLYTMHFHPDYDAQTISREHHDWNRRYAGPLKQFIKPHSNDRNPQRRLRIGYVSPDFHEHPGGHNVLALLSAHDPTQVEVFCYAQVANPDSITQRIRGYAHQWRNTFHLSDQQLAEQIRQDQIDILIDLAGHTGGNRLLVFARKPAPVQVTWLGYPNTTGLTTMDYRLTDALADPPQTSDALCSEHLIRLPHTAWCFVRPLKDPPPIEKPADDATPITFGSFNNFSKITTSMLKTWAQILRQVPDSKLLIKAQALRSQTAIQRVQQIMEAAGVASARLELQGWRKSREEHLASYQQVDIALDTFPYHGTTTTREALWMGVPVVTLAGTTHVSRVGVSLLTNVGLPELIAQSEDEYVRLAIELASNRPRLSTLRRSLRQQMEQSPLMDAPRFARDVESAYRQMWVNWCATAGLKT